MKPDFTKIQDERVGYNIRANSMSEPIWLEKLTFEQFISPYTNKATTPQQVYQNLEQALAKDITQQDSVIDNKRPVTIDVLADATLKREAMLNAMELIYKTYLNRISTF